MKQALDIEIKAILESRRSDWQSIAKGADVSYSWIAKFVAGHIPNPGYATLKRLHDRLTRKEPATDKAGA